MFIGNEHLDMEGSEAGRLQNVPVHRASPRQEAWPGSCQQSNSCHCLLVLWHEEPKITVVPTSVALSQCLHVEAPVIPWNLIQFQLHLKGHKALGGDQVMNTAQDTAPISAAGLAHTWQLEARPCIVHSPLWSSFT